MKKLFLEYKLLKLLSAKHSPFSNRAKARFARSAAKRAPFPLRDENFFTPTKRIPSFLTRTLPKLTVVVMARNEAHRLDDSMRHLCALFDKIIFVDHLSDDDTGKIAAQYDQVNDTEVVVLRGEDKGYYQSEYMTAVANALIKQGSSDWIFFLDIDEFLPFASATEFRQALVALSSDSVINMHWLNVALDEDGLETLQGASGLTAPVVSRFVKIALNTANLPEGKVEILQGNHACVLANSHVAQVGTRSFGLFHVPIFGLDSLRAKVKQGSSALAETIGKPKELGNHWREIHESIDKFEVDKKLAQEVALNYGESLSQIIEAFSKGGLMTSSRPITLKFAQITAAHRAAIVDQPNIFTLATIDDVLSRVLCSSDKTIGENAELGQPKYQALPSRVFVKSDECAVERKIAHAILSAATDVEVIVPTAWHGHIPFLFTLMEIQRPRRYVELGTHAGASFFSACQHMRSNGNYGEAVAIDLWTGDHQAGKYDESVFEEFKRLLAQHFPETGKFVRGYFADSACLFQDKSINLLHIDGLHTYEAVREDYETWLPKLADNGVILFHDTNEYQTDFGVWQLFNEVRGDAAESFQFRHGHGLGVMAFGSSEESPAISLIQYLNANAKEVESYYATLGNALFNAARFRFAWSD